MAGWHHDNADWTHKECVVCGNLFVPRSGVHKFCSLQCRGKWKYITGVTTTESQYASISGNWKRYFDRLVSQKKREDLSTEELLHILELQDGKCALSGVTLTCKLEKGKKFLTNASIDRIDAGGPYIPDNVQLVCTALNSWRSDIPLEEFIWWCRQVANWQEEEGI